MKVHELKIWPEYYEPGRTREKTYEVRKDDRDYEVGDLLILKEWNPETGDYTGRKYMSKVTHILRNKKKYVPEGYCILSTRPIPNRMCIDCHNDLDFNVYRYRKKLTMKDALFKWLHAQVLICKECESYVRKTRKELLDKIDDLLGEKHRLVKGERRKDGDYFYELGLNTAKITTLKWLLGIDDQEI
jgi:hypothetical protein